MRKLVNYVHAGIKCLFLFLFVYTATSKFIEFRAFKSVLSQLPIIGGQAAVLAWALPLTEIMVAALLVFKRTERVGMFASLFLMTIFCAYIVFMLLYVPDLPCSCGGIIRDMSWTAHLTFNLFFVCLAILSIVFPTEQKRLK